MENKFRLDLFLSRAREIVVNEFRRQYKKDTGEEWKDDAKSTQKRFFENGKGRCRNISFEKDRKHFVEQSIDHWDLTVLNNLFRNTYLVEPPMMREIIQVRNSLSHSVDGRLPHYDKLLKTCEKFLLSNKIQAEEINDLKNLPLSDLMNPTMTVNEFYQGALGFMEIKEYDDAISELSRALGVMGITPRDKAKYYIKLGECYFNKARGVSYNKRSVLSQAESHAILGKSLDPIAVTAYTLLASIYESQGECGRAESSLEMASILEPNNKEISNRLHKIRISAQIKASGETPDEPYTYDLEKIVDELQDRQSHVNRDLLRTLVGAAMETFKTLPGQEQLQEARGLQREGKYTKALELYQSAVSQGNAEAMYSLAKLKLIGKYTDSDFEGAITLLRRAASQNAFFDLDGRKTPRLGVADAECELGRCYENGIGVPKDHIQAIMWYERAMQHSSPEASYQLGLLYINGDKIERNLDIAERFLLGAWSKGIKKSALVLCAIYFTIGKIDEVKLWRDRYYSATGDSSYNAKIDSTIQQYAKLKQEAGPEMFDYLCHFLEINVTSKPHILKNSSNCRYNPEVLHEYAERGGLYAKRLLDSQFHFSRALFSVTTSETWTESVLESMATGLKLAGFVCIIDAGGISWLISEMKQYLEYLRCENEDSENARMILAYYLSLTSSTEGLQFLDVSLTIFPNSAMLYHLRGSLYAFDDKFERALVDFTESHRLEPTEYDYVYSIAVALKNIGDFEKASKTYNEFLQMAPRDHRKRPASYYALGMLCMASRQKTFVGNNEANLKMIETYFNKGIEAERDMMSCFLPIDDTCKNLLEMIVKAKSESSAPSTLNQYRLLDPTLDLHRKQITLDHRKNFADIAKMRTSATIALTNSAPRSQCGMNMHDTHTFTSITFNQMDMTRDMVWKDRILKLKIIDLPILYSGIRFVVTDINGFVEYMWLYNFKDTFDQMQLKLRVGQEISIRNPYYRHFSDGSNGIRVDVPDSVVFLNFTLCCWCCGQKAESPIKCRDCQKALYCSQACRERDDFILGHKLYCEYIGK